MVYLWDNYIQYVDCVLAPHWRSSSLAANRLTAARRVILMGHGPGCNAIMSMIQQRGESPHPCSHKSVAKVRIPAASVVKTVEGVVQVVGLHNIPTTPPNTGNLRQWYFDVSCTSSDTLTTKSHPTCRTRLSSCRPTTPSSTTPRRSRSTATSFASVSTAPVLPSVFMAHTVNSRRRRETNQAHHQGHAWHTKLHQGQVHDPRKRKRRRVVVSRPV